MPVRQRMALLAAFGMADVAAPDRFIIALAALELLADTDTRQLHAMAPGLVDQTIERAGGNRKDPMHPYRRRASVGGLWITGIGLAR